MEIRPHYIGHSTGRHYHIRSQAPLLRRSYRESRDSYSRRWQDGAKLASGSPLALRAAGPAGDCTLRRGFHRPETERATPITPFLHGEDFDQETTRIMAVALEIACVALRTGDCADLALLICEQVLKDIRRPQMEAEPL